MMSTSVFTIGKGIWEIPEERLKSMEFEISKFANLFDTYSSTCGDFLLPLLVVCHVILGLISIHLAILIHLG